VEKLRKETAFTAESTEDTENGKDWDKTKTAEERGRQSQRRRGRVMFHARASVDSIGLFSPLVC
jgi:hypothetical protein